MRIRKSPLVVGALFVAGTAFAQGDTTRRPTSTQRIPLSKEPVSQPMVSRVDTVTMYRTDTVTQYRTDTVTVTRVDTVTTSTSAGVVEMPAMLRQIGGFYIGVDGGAAVPQGDAFTNS